MGSSPFNNGWKVGISWSFMTSGSLWIFRTDCVPWATTIISSIFAFCLAGDGAAAKINKSRIKTLPIVIQHLIPINKENSTLQKLTFIRTRVNKRVNGKYVCIHAHIWKVTVLIWDSTVIEWKIYKERKMSHSPDELSSACLCSASPLCSAPIVLTLN